MKILYNFSILLCLIGASTAINAQTHNWIGNGGDNNWFTASNWDSGTIPIATSSVAIAGNFVVNISGNSAEANTLDLFNGATLQLESDLMTVSIITIHPNSTLEFISGSLSGSGILNNGLLKLEGTGNRTFNQVIINNNAQFLVTNSSLTQIINTTINNNSTGVIDISSVGGFLQQGSSSTINNEGVIKKTPDGINPIGNFYLILEINNQGSIDVQMDQIFLLLAGASTFTNFETGRMIGNGTYDITTSFINAGTVSPGSSPDIGALDITNIFSLNGGTIEIDIASTNEFDGITIFGSPVMEGTIDVNLLFAPQIGNEFTIITWNNSGGSCSFPQFTTAIFNGFEYTFEIFCNSNDVTLKVLNSTILGLDNLSLEAPIFYVLPNPVTQKATFIFSSELISLEENTMVIYNYLGQQILAIENFTSKNNVFHRGNLPSGLYFAQLRDSRKVLATTRLVLD